MTRGEYTVRATVASPTPAARFFDTLARTRFMTNPTRPVLRFLAWQGLAVALLLLVFEAVLRVGFDRPAGWFNYALTSDRGLYPESTRIPMLWGPIPYVVHTNSLGFRGREIAVRKTPGTLRIAAVGDSMTDGFFVDDEHTYPFVLQDLLQARGHAVEVLNAARGGGSIGKELAIVREVVLPLDPDLVVLTFVSNDLSDIAKKPGSALLGATLRGARTGVADWLRARTAVGEFIGDAALAWRNPAYRRARRDRERRLSAPNARRYAIEGGDRFEANLAKFRISSPMAGPMLERAPFPPIVERLVETYVEVLVEFARVCGENGVRVALVYFPSYAQIYDDNFSPAMSDRLAAESESLGIAYLDVTPAFRRERHRVLHLAPLDYHTNPAGYRLFAESVAEFLEGSGLLSKSAFRPGR